MEIKEMIRKVYQKSGVQVDDDYIEYKMQDKEKVRQFMRIYKQEEIESMNYILGKSKNNQIFTKKELVLFSKIDLFDKTTVEACRNIYKKKMKEGASKCI